MRRLTRDEKKAQTRARLLQAAARVFARRGYHAASVDDVAQEAGFTKGAVYSNFASKEDLFLALLEWRLEERLADVEAMIARDRSIEEQATAAGADFMRMLQHEREWMLLFIEFWAYAVRDARLRKRFASLWAKQRATTARIIEERAAEMGVALTLPATSLATAAMAMGNGIALEKLADPNAVPDELYGFMLSSFFSGVSAARVAASSDSDV